MVCVLPICIGMYVVCMCGMSYAYSESIHIGKATVIKEIRRVTYCVLVFMVYILSQLVCTLPI
jgi:hypothetical protein